MNRISISVWQTFVRINSPVDCQKFRKGGGYSHADDEQGVEHGQCHQDLFECHLRDQIKIVNFDKAANNKTEKSILFKDQLATI